MRNEVFVYLEIYTVYLEIYEYGKVVQGVRVPDAKRHRAVKHEGFRSGIVVAQEVGRYRLNKDSFVN